MRIKVLLVDDDATLLDIAPRFLKKFNNNLQITAIQSASEALEKLGNNGFDVVVSDYQMPDMDGLMLLEQIRSRMIDTPYIVFTGRGREEVAIRALNLGADYYLTKGGDPSSQYAELAHLIQRIYDHSSAEKKLRESQRAYEDLVNQMSQGLAILEQEPFKIVFANNEMERITGYSKDEITAWSLDGLLERVHLFDREYIRRQFRYRTEGKTGISRYDARFLKNDGSLVWCEVTTSKIEYQGQDAILGLFLDITEQKRKEIRLDDALEYASDIFNNSPTGLFIYQYEPEDKLILLDGNPEAIRLTGITLDEWRGRLFSDLWPQAHQDGTESSFLKAVKTGSPFQKEDYIYRDEKLAGIYKVTAFALPGKRLCVAFEDVTEQKTYESLLERQHQELSTFARKMKHDITSQLQVILNLTEMQSMREDVRNLQDINQHVREIIRLLETSVELAESGDVIGKRTKVDLHSLLSEITKKLVPDHIIVTIGSLPFVKADRLKLKQVFNNILLNAVEHGQPEKISISSEDNGTSVVILIKNDGVQIDQETRDLILTPGFSTKKKGGLGLEITRKILAAHDWSIDLIDCGETCFRISIPAYDVVIR